MSLEDSNEKKEENKEIKVILLGESGVGKTNLINVAMNQKFEADSKSNLVNSFSRGVFNYEGNDYLYTLWDTAGQEKFRALNNLFIKGANIVIIVFAIDNRESFKEISYWINKTREILGKEEYVIALAANKSDLFYEKDSIPDEEIDNAAKEYNMRIRRTSAYSDAKGFKQYLNELLTSYLKKAKPKTKESHLKIIKEDKSTVKKKKYC